MKTHLVTSAGLVAALSSAWPIASPAAHVDLNAGVYVAETGGGDDFSGPVPVNTPFNKSVVGDYEKIERPATMPPGGFISSEATIEYVPDDEDGLFFSGSLELAAKAQVQNPNPFPGGSHYQPLGASASVYYSDTITVLSSNPAALLQTYGPDWGDFIHIDPSLSASGVIVGNAVGGAFVEATFGDIPKSQGFSGPGIYNFSPNFGSVRFSDLFSEPRTLTFFLSVSASADTQGAMFTDFSHTLKLLPFVVSDRFGNDFPGSDTIRIVGEDGRQYAVRPVPEPASMSIVAIALLAACRAYQRPQSRRFGC
jgi:hypothetical protein